MVNEIRRTAQRIEKAFPRTATPFPEWEVCETIHNFTERYGKDFFALFWPRMHDDFQVTRFLFPFMMEYFLTDEVTADSGLTADLFIGTLDPVAQKEVQKDFALDKLSASLTREQRSVVCEWLHVMKKKDDLLVNVENAIAYWCQTR